MKIEKITRYKIILDKINSVVEKFSHEEVFQNASYETGLLGFSLYYLYLAKYTENTSYHIIAEDYLNKGLAAFNPKTFKRVHSTDSLDAHLSNIGRYLVFCKVNNLLNVSSEEYLINLDQILFDLMKSKIKIKDFDSGTGALSSGHYFLSRMKNGEDVSEQLKFLIKGLSDAALSDENGNYFWKSPALYDRIYLGISHGSALIISFVASVYELGLEKELCKNILEKGVTFLRGYYRSSEYKGLFPNIAGEKPEPMQFSLCYGDLGVGYALFRAYKILNDTDGLDFSALILDDCLLRKKDDNLTLDASIYYGAAGLAITFYQLAEICHDKRFAERAEYWISQIPEYAVHQNNFAGFQSRLADDNIVWQVSFGWGVIGFGMMLMYSEDKALPNLADLTFLV